MGGKRRDERQEGGSRPRGRREPLPLVLPVVLYNGAGPWRAPLDTAGLFAASENFVRFIPKMEYIVIDERRLALERPEFLSSLSAQWIRYNRAADPAERAESMGALARILRDARYDGLNELKRTFASMFAVNLRRDRISGNWQKLLDDNKFEEVGMSYAAGVRRVELPHWGVLACFFARKMSKTCSAGSETRKMAAKPCNYMKLFNLPPPPFQRNSIISTGHVAPAAALGRCLSAVFGGLFRSFPDRKGFLCEV